MKRTILSLAFLAILSSANAQVFESNDFTAYTNGNIGTSTTGTVAGQGGFYTANGLNSDYRILNGGVEHGRVFQLTGSATATGDRFMWKDGLPNAWSNRDAGNDILEIVFDYYTGPVTTSQNSMRINIYNADLSKVLGGFMITQDTKVISGLAYYEDDPGNGTYQYNLGTDSNPIVTLPADTWVKLGFSFKKTDGKVTWKGPGFDAFTNGTTAGENPAEIDFIATAIYTEGADNTVAGTARFDNYEVRAVNVDGLLSVDEIQNNESNAVVVFPNPVNDVANIEINKNTIDKIIVSDLNGRVVKEAVYGNISKVGLDLTGLSKGMYLLNITSGESQIVKKIIKK